MAKEAKKNKTTKADLEYFESECRRWLDFFGMKGWAVSYEHNADEECKAQAGWSISGRMARFFLAEDWGSDQITRVELSRCAFHEVCELLFAELSDMAKSWVCDQEVFRATHSIIRTLENVVWEKEYTSYPEPGGVSYRGYKRPA